MKPSYSARERLLTVSILCCVAFCHGQSVAQTQTLDPVQSAELPATSPQKQDKPADQPSAAINSQEQSSPDQQKKNKNDRMFYVMPNYLTVEGQSQVPPISWKEKFAI